jgi:hypothetical protein
VKTIRQSSRVRARARARELLILAMGGACKHCGRRDFLEMHFTGGEGREHHIMNSLTRLVWYQKQHDAGLLMLLCTACHEAETVRLRAHARARGFTNDVRVAAGLPALPSHLPK